MSLRKVPNLEDFQFQPSIKDKDLSSPPGGLTKGDRYIVAATGSGNWSGQTGNIAIYNGVTWDFVTKREGMILWIDDENLYYKYDGSNWTIGSIDISSLIEKTTIVDNDLLLIEDSESSNLKKKIKKSTLFGNFTESKLSQIINNIFLAFFKISVLGGLSKYNLVDGIMDEFEDETGIGTKTNAIYNSTDDYYSPLITLATLLDYMEYSSDGNAQAAYVTNGALTSVFPPAHNDTYVKATSDWGENYKPYLATDPTKTVIGSWTGNMWDTGTIINQRFHIDLGSAKIINRIYYENNHNAGASTTAGVKNFTLWGSNTSGDFNDLVYANNGTWVAITGVSQSTFDQHTGSDIADPKYITVTNNIAYRYYALKFADNWGGLVDLGFRRIQLQEFLLQSYSESTIKNQGSYSLKGIATITTSLNKTLTRTIGSPINLTDQIQIKFDIYSSRTGANIKVGIHDAGGTTSEKTYTVLSANTWETVTWDISGVSNANKDAIDQIIITIINADSTNTFYIDNIYAGENLTNNMTLISTTTVAEVTPTKSRIVLFEEDVDSVTINTDLTAEISRDNGTTYTLVTLVDEGDYDTSRRIISTESVDISGQPSGTNMKYRIKTLNNKNLKLHAVGESWD